MIPVPATLEIASPVSSSEGEEDELEATTRMEAKRMPRPSAPRAAPSADPPPEPTPSAPAAFSAPPVPATPFAEPPKAPDPSASPWFANQGGIDAQVLPSANVLQQPAAVEPAPPPPPAMAARPSSRAAMTVALAVAAVALIAAVAYFVMLDTGSETDPADVDLGSEQRDYGDNPAPQVTASATAAPAPKPRPATKPPPPRPKSGNDDPYDGL